VAAVLLQQRLATGSIRMRTPRSLTPPGGGAAAPGGPAGTVSGGSSVAGGPAGERPGSGAATS
jgi:ribose transport system permease protein